MTLRTPAPQGWFITAASLPGALSGVYLGALAILSRPDRSAPSSSGSAGSLGVVEHEFPVIAVVVPAHNEERNVAATVASLAATDYPRDRRLVVVVADNCRDATASEARAAGARVLERTDDVHQGKGFALAMAFDELLADPTIDAIAVIDADTSVSANLLSEMAAAFASGASAVQADYGVRNANASWRTRLMVVALSCFHGVRSTARERLGLSCGLRGTGMGFSRQALLDVPHHATGLVEDVEHGIELGLAGHRVRYLGRAHVWGEMPTSGAGASTQRDRWERGRRQLLRRWGPPLARGSAHSRVAADLLVDLLVPPLAQIAVGLVAAAAIGTAVLGTGSLPVAFSVLGLGGVVVYVARGWQLSGTGRQGLVDLAAAPVYVGWKIGSKAIRRLHRQGDQAWIRTSRE